jgi:hypothetical protein
MFQMSDSLVVFTYKVDDSIFLLATQLRSVSLEIEDGNRTYEAIDST